VNVTLDASVWLASVSPGEPHYQSSRALLEALLRRRADFVQPELFMVEVVGTVARRSKDPAYALTMAREALALPRLRVASGGEPATTAAVHAAATCALRGADAIYVATAQLHDSLLVTLDWELFQRARPLVRTSTPEGWLAGG
jgi:predicted nucleic acid-binding protein